MKTAIITGSSNGIGANIVQEFVAQGYNVVGLDMVIPTHNSNQQNYTFMQCDLRDTSAIATTFANIKAKFGACHVLINNAGVANFSKNISAVTDIDYSNILDTNLRGAYFCSKQFISLNKGETYGRIINIASTRWHQNEADWELYGMSKGGVVSLTNSLCVSLQGNPITVNAISPGYIETKNYDSLDPQEHIIHPSNRVGKPQDISRVCLFLCEENNDFINGANIVVDGGMTKKMIY